jgi:hypothetical protein
MSITFCVVCLHSIEVLSRTLERVVLAVSPGPITQGAWMRMQPHSFEPDAVMLTEGAEEPEVAEVRGRFHTCEIQMPSSRLFATFRAPSVTYRCARGIHVSGNEWKCFICSKSLQNVLVGRCV